MGNDCISKTEAQELIDKAIDKEKEKDWYNNKELFKMLNDVKESFTNQLSKHSKEMQGLWTELKGTREDIKKYNGLRKIIEKVQMEFYEFKRNYDLQESKKTGARKGKVDLVKWGGWLLGIISTIITIYARLGG